MKVKLLRKIRKNVKYGIRPDGDGKCTVFAVDTKAKNGMFAEKEIEEKKVIQVLIQNLLFHKAPDFELKYMERRAYVAGINALKRLK